MQIERIEVLKTEKKKSKNNNDYYIVDYRDERKNLKSAYYFEKTPLQGGEQYFVRVEKLNDNSNKIAEVYSIKPITQTQSVGLTADACLGELVKIFKKHKLKLNKYQDLACTMLGSMLIEAYKREYRYYKDTMLPLKPFEEVQ